MTQETPTLTPDQQKGADAFFDFLMTDAKTFVLSGGAGVGKTFLMSYLVRRVMQDYADACKLMDVREEYHELGFTATTNKAAEVLEESLQRPVSTIHSFLGLRVTDDWKTGKQKIIKTQAWEERRGFIVFIDEASMVDSVLYKIIMESFPNSKIVFVGDHCQMSPVGEAISPVYLNVDPDNFVFLGQPVRNAGQPELIKVCAQLRETVETGVFRPIEDVPGVVDYLEDADMEYALNHIFQEMDPSCRTLCYTNTRVDFFNGYIREEVRGQPDEFQVGDILVVARTHTQGKRVINVEREVEVLEIGDPEIDESHVHIFEDGKPIHFRVMKIRLLTGSRETFNVRVPKDKERVTLAMKHYARLKSWPDYFDLRDSYMDLRDKAACTVYKSQGSTYESVFIDLGNIGTSFDAEQVARMLFVAFTRATTRVFLYGQLPHRYHDSKGKSLWTERSISLPSSTSCSQKMSAA